MWYQSRDQKTSSRNRPGTRLNRSRVMYGNAVRIALARTGSEFRSNSEKVPAGNGLSRSGLVICDSNRLRICSQGTRVLDELAVPTTRKPKTAVGIEPVQ